MKEVIVIVVGFLLSATLVFLLYTAQANVEKKCAAKGAVAVQTNSEVICVKKEAIVQ